MYAVFQIDKQNIFSEYRPLKMYLRTITLDEIQFNATLQDIKSQGYYVTTIINPRLIVLDLNKTKDFVTKYEGFNYPISSPFIKAFDYIKIYTRNKTLLTILA